VSTLWTPSGEHEPRAPHDAGAPDAGAPEGAETLAHGGDDEALREELGRVRAELAGTPVADLVANHAIGLWQLAVLHLTPDDGAPRLDEAALAIDAMAALVEGLGDRLADNATPLRDALAQLRMAFVQVTERAGAPSADA
jgi:hypothetical protein